MAFVAGLGLDRAAFEEVSQFAVECHKKSFSCTVRRSIALLDCFFFGHVLALFGFAIIARPWLPILSTPGIHPDLAGSIGSLRHAARRRLRNRRIRANVLFICFDPI